MNFFLQVLERLRGSGFRDIQGARVSATVPIGERLLNELVAASLPRSGALREASIHPQADNRLIVRARLSRPEFLPPVSATLVIERQPQLPHSPVLAFRVTGLPGLLALAGPFLPIASMLPPGVRLDSDLLTVDLAALLAAHGQRELLGYLETLRVTSEDRRLVIECTARVRDAPP
jgi:hypothetical protein